MKKVILVVLIAVAGWWYFIGSRKLSEQHVRDFYRDVEIATLERKPEALCALLAEDFQSAGTVSIGDRRHTEAQNKAQTCEGYKQLYDTWEKLGEKMGGILQLDSGYEIHSVAIASDQKTATVDISTSLDVAGSIMNIRSRSTDTLVRRNGKMLMLRSEGEGSVGGGS